MKKAPYIIGYHGAHKSLVSVSFLGSQEAGGTLSQTGIGHKAATKLVLFLLSAK